MSQETRTTLKGYFNTGDVPTETQFANLIDSVPNIADGELYPEEKIYITDNLTVTGDGTTSDILAADPGKYFIITSVSIVLKSVIGDSSDSYINLYYNAGTSSLKMVSYGLCVAGSFANWVDEMQNTQTYGTLINLNNPLKLIVRNFYATSAIYKVYLKGIKYTI